MTFFTILMVFGPIVALLVLGVVFYNLLNSGYMYGRSYVGWALVVTEIVIFFWAAIRQAGAGGMGFTALAYIALLGYIFILQGSLIAELLVLTFMPDRSAGLKLLKSYSMAERNIIEDDLSGSVAEYENAIVEDPNDVEARLRLAEVSFQNAEYQKTVEAYEAALRLGKKLGAERKCLILTRLAQIYAEQFHDDAKARKLLETIINKYPDTRFSKYAEERMARL